MRAKRIAADPTYLIREAEYEEEIQRLILNNADRGERDVIITIPIVFHILHLGGDENITNEQILNAVDLLNEDYRALNADADNVHPAFLDLVGDAEIQFALPTLDPNGNCTNGIDRIFSTETLVGDDGSKLNGWPRDKYLNVWITLFIGDEGTAGYAYKPTSSTDQIFRLLDGILILQDYIGEIGSGTPFRSTALTHEIGHYLNLDHVWGNNNGVEPDAPQAPTGHMVPDCGDDLVEDTPVTRGWNICPAYNDPVFDWADCDNIQLSTLVYDFDAVTTTSGTNDPTVLVNATDTVADVARIRTQMRAFSATGVSTNSTAAERFAFSGWDQGPVDGEVDFAFLPGSLNGTKYYSFRMDPSITDLLTVDSIGFRVKRNATGIRTFAVRSSADNFATNLPIRSGGNPNISIKPGNIAFYNTDVTTEVATMVVDPGAVGYLNLIAPITFRLYAWNAEDANGTVRVCSNGIPVDLFDKLGGAPQAGGTWSGPSTTDGTFDPATMLAGDYTYSLPAAGACAAYSATVTVSLIDPPATPTITGASAICAGSATILTSSSTTGNLWTPGGQTTATRSVSTAGTYSVSVSAGGCSATSGPFVVTSVPQANAGGNDALTVCEVGAAVPLFNSLTGTPQEGGSWDVGPSLVVDGLFDPATMLAGAYQYVVQGNAPCANDTSIVTVTLSPTATAGTNGTLTICNNAIPVDLFDRLGGAPQSGGVWTGPSPTTGLFDPVTMSAGTYTYNADTVAALCGESTATVIVVETSAPAQPTITGPTTLCAGGSITLTSSSATAYAWSPGGQTTQAISVGAAGIYAVTSTAGACSSTSEPFAVVTTTRSTAGRNGTVTACPDGGAFSLFPSLEGTPDGIGTWSGPSAVTDGLYDPATMEPGDYEWLVSGTAPCPNDSAIVTVTESSVLNAVSGTFEVDDVRVFGTSGLIENVENYMEYSYCSKMYTVGQVARMRAAANSSTGDRSSTWSDANLQAVGVADGFQAQCPPTADFYARTVLTSVAASQAIPYSRTVCTGTDVEFIDNSGGAIPTGWSWTFQDGEPATSTARNPVVSFNTPGYKTVTLTVSNGVGSNTKTDNYAILIGGGTNDVTGAFTEGFEDDDNLSPWIGVNYENNGTLFQRTTSAHYSGNACAVLNSGYRNALDLIDQGNEEDYDDLISPTMDLSGLQSAQLSFRYAYSTSASTLGLVTENLIVSSSVDCGKTWIFRDELSGEDLINNGNNPQLPPPAWALSTINLPNSVRVSNVRFRFRYVSSVFSNNLYIDDINISGPVGIEDLTLANFMSLYPNPSNDRFSLAVYGMDRFDTEVIVQDIRGAQIYRSIHRPAGQAGMEFSGSQLGLAQGVYLIRASNEAGSSTQKLIISK